MRLSVPMLALAIAANAPAQKREYLDLQRDVALMQDQVRTLQKLNEEKFAALTALVQQAIEQVGKTAGAVETLDRAVQAKLAQQEKSLVAPIAALGGKMSDMATEFASVREAVSETNGQMRRLQTQLNDLKNAVTVLQAPAPPPAVAAPAQDPNKPPPGMTADSLFASARNYMLGGQNDPAIQQFQDYLRYYPNTDLAPNAQFYIGDLQLKKENIEEAIKAFDAVIELPENAKTPDAIYMKGVALTQNEQKNAAAMQFRELIKRYPNHELARKAQQQLRTAPPAARGRKR
ncbi:MAG: tetratricopeptide repeat protein [Acidobacteria bacterium]|nr:tetratricopeptide repeat protein [Acidobacteriota bacterium]